MDISEYAKDLERRQRLADAVGSSSAYIYQIATGHRRASTKLAQRIDEATRGAVSKESLRPDVWGASRAA